MRYDKPRRRSSKDIAYAITKSACGGQKKTRIMYAAGLNLTQLNEYLANLSDLGLLTLDDHRIYATTEKGRQFVKAYERYSETRDMLREQEKILQELLDPIARRSSHLEVLPALRA